MKYVIVSFIIAILLISCQGSGEKAENDLIAVSILPQKYFVEQIAGNTLNINVMVPPGASPATYDPSPKAIAAISQAIAYFKIGPIGFEKAWDSKLKSINEDLKFFDLSENISLIHSEEGHSGHHGADPHIWMSVNNVKQIAENTFNALKELKPGHLELYQTNYKLFLQKLDSLDLWIRNQLENSERKTFIIFHPALTYYAKDYGLNQISLEFEGKQPTPRHFQHIVELANEKGIQHVFIQKQFDTESALTLANQLGAEIVTIDPLDVNWEYQIKNITQKLKEALNKS